MSKGTSSRTGLDNKIINIELRLRLLGDTKLSLMRMSIQVVVQQLAEFDIVLPRTLPQELGTVPREKMQVILRKIYVDIQRFVTTMGFIADSCRAPANLERSEMIDTAIDTIQEYITLLESHKEISRLHVFYVHGVPLGD
ncbi:hypothetical protein L2E82_29680 [Cichorium intybus]|uniref:Uncharacterized protein n=1 Tax=Cichorium intybus TaxID=13427 RepID=A0ACB9CYA7_CICIN|nr:hypothetical protein L2E82_29680 [Cichorium intybus]